MSRVKILLIPQNTSGMLSVSLTRNYVRFIKYAFLAFILLTFYVVFQYVSYLNSQRNFSESLKINELISFYLQDILNSSKNFSQKFTDLSNFDEKLRSIMNFKEQGQINYSVEANSKGQPILPSSYSNNGKLLEAITQVNIENSIKFGARENSFVELQTLIADNKQKLLSTPSIKPVRLGYLTSGFGPRLDPFSNSYKFHYGIDFAYLTYTAIYATANGIVSKSYTSESYGNTVVINNGYGFETLFAHLAQALVKPGQLIKRGELIGRMGNTGKRSTATHLHYEVHINGKPVDPAKYILEDLPEVTNQLFVEY